MRALLDTHTFLWWITDDPRLSRRAREIISKGENKLFFSAASAWEMHRDPFDRLLIAQARLENLPILTADPQIGRYDVEVIW